MTTTSKQTTIIIRNTCDEFDEFGRWQWTIRVLVEPSLQGSIDRIVAKEGCKNGEIFELFRCKQDNCVFVSPTNIPASTCRVLKVNIYLKDNKNANHAHFVTTGGAEKYKKTFKHEIDFPEAETEHKASINVSNGNSCRASGPEKLNVTVSNNCESKSESWYYWMLFVKVDESLDERIERVEMKPLHGGYKHDLIQSPVDLFTYTTERLLKAEETFELSIRLYLKKDICAKKGAQETTRIELVHYLRFKKCLKEGSFHSTHHSGMLLIETPVEESQNDETTAVSSAEDGCPWPRPPPPPPTLPPPPLPPPTHTPAPATPKHTSAIPPSRWCITYDQLMNVEKKAMKKFGKTDYPNKTMRDICNAIIEPKCNKTGTSYALHLNREGLPVDVFISHGWDGQFAAFVQSIRSAFQTVMAKPNLWICAFALVQGQSEELISQQVGSSEDPLENSPFVQAIKAASTYCVVRNSNRDIYGRIWCVCELIYANHYGLFPKRTHVTGPDFFALKKSSVLDAQASRLEDRDRILRVLLTEFNRREIDGIVHQLRMQSTPQDETTIS